MENDERFSHVATDPKFRRIPKSEKKVKIDKRFQSMFKDKKFKVKYTTDKRGRPINQTSSEDLKRYYDLSSDSESESNSDQVQDEDANIGKYVRRPSEDEQNDVPKSNHKSNQQIPEGIKEKLKDLQVDYARGESKLLSDSSSESDEDSESGESDIVEHAWGELDRDAEKTEEASSRLAVCNMDWDRMRATDLIVLFNSFLPPGGSIKSVTIYPSEYGLKRMQEEETKGPIELIEPNNTLDEEKRNEEATEGSNYHMEKLRQYQLNRLKYYYAIVECDTVNTAIKIYAECDGLEYESTATKLDLRFVPEDMKFDQSPKEVCNKLPEQGKYQPRFFTTTALQQAKVDLTWDETDPTRVEITQKLAKGDTDLTEGDLQTYLASSSGSDEESEKSGCEEEKRETSENPLDKYKSLLQEIEQKEEQKSNNDVEMEITWGIDLKEKTEKLVKEKLAKKEEQTPFEQYLEKRKEKRKERRKAKKKENVDSENDDSDSVNVDMSDPYFAEEFQNGEFRKPKKSKQHLSNSEEISEQKKAELELLLLDEQDDKKHFSLSKIQQAEDDSQKKRKRKKNKVESNQQEDDFKMNVKDERFSALYTSHHFNLDPTDPHYKRTKGMEMLVEEKLKRRNMVSTVDSNSESNKKSKKSLLGTELNMLVKSVKQKTKMLNDKKALKSKK